MHQRKVPKVLVALPHPSFHGGVGNIFKTIEWSESDEVFYFYNTQENKSGSIRFALLMVIRFLAKIRSRNTVHLNPSLNRKSVVRDGALLLLAKIFRKKIVVFFHGWDDSYEMAIKKNKFYIFLFSAIFSRADCFVLLGEIFNKKLSSLNVKTKKVFYIPTIADDRFFQNKSTHRTKKPHEVNILFIAAFVPQKGVDIVLQTFERLLGNAEGFEFHLTMAGDGPELARCMSFAQERKLKNLTFTGYVSGIEKHKCFDTADILFFPSLNEGLPCVIMEGMLYGLVVVTRPIGGIPYWVTQNINGWVSASTDPNAFTDGILSLVRNPELMCSIKRKNQETAIENFTPTKIKDKIRSVYSDVWSADNYTRFFRLIN